MRSVLVHAELWKVASGEVKQGDANAGTDWPGKDEKALAMITLSIKPSQLGNVKNAKTSFDAWSALKGVHQPSGPVRKVSLYKKLRMVKGQNMSNYIRTFVEILDLLAAVGIEINSELQTIILLSSLPKRCKNFVVAIAYLVLTFFVSS